MSTETEPEKQSGLETTQDRIDAIQKLGMPIAAIIRFLENRELRVPSRGEHFYKRAVEILDDDELRELIQQHKYAGRQTVNYFVINGIGNYELDDIKDKVDSRLPRQDNVGQVPKEPFLAEGEIIGTRLYLAIGYYQNAGSEDPVTGKKEEKVITKRTVVVIQDDMDLVEIRGSDTTMVEKVRDEVCKSIGKFRDSVKSRPNLGPDFQSEFNDRVERYFNLKVKVDDKDDETLDTISFTSKKNEDGERHDARDSKRVARELSSDGSEITMGYVELSEGFRFRINRDQAKLSFMKAEREENLEVVTKVIDEVLREAGEYSQGEISGISDVPE
jgi:hypothetical protein